MNRFATPITYVAGTVASDPERKESRIGELFNFRLAVTATLPGEGEKYGETHWYDVVTKNPGLGASILRDIYKGAKIMVQGRAETQEYNGGLQYSIWADRIALVEYLRREQIAQTAAPAASTDELGF